MNMSKTLTTSPNNCHHSLNHHTHTYMYAAWGTPTYTRTELDQPGEKKSPGVFNHIHDRYFLNLTAHEAV